MNCLVYISRTHPTEFFFGMKEFEAAPEVGDRGANEPDKPSALSHAFLLPVRVLTGKHLKKKAQMLHKWAFGQP